MEKLLESLSALQATEKERSESIVKVSQHYQDNLNKVLDMIQENNKAS